MISIRNIASFFVLGTVLSTAGAVAAEPFNGFYAGALAGWQQDRFGATAGQGIDRLSGSENSSGLSYGAFAGYNFNINGNGILGAEAAISGATNSLKDDAESIELKSGRTIELVGRAGALISQKTLIVGRAGWSNARFTVPVSDVSSLGATLNGFTVGAGVEHLVADNVSIRLDYAYSQYERIRSGYAVAPGVIETFSIRPTRNAVKAGVSFHF